MKSSAKQLWSLILIGLLPLGMLHAQSGEDAFEEDEARSFYWGFSLGLEGGFLQGSENPSDTAMQRFTGANSLPGFGVSVGLSTSFRLSEKLSLKPALVLALLPTRIEFSRAQTAPESPLLYPFTAELPVHLVFGNPLETSKAAGFIGASGEFNIPSMEDGRFASTPFALRADAGLSIPVNLGLGESLLDVSYGINLTELVDGSAVYDQWWDRLYRHRIAVRLHLF